MPLMQSNQICIFGELQSNPQSSVSLIEQKNRWTKMYLEVGYLAQDILLDIIMINFLLILWNNSPYHMYM